MNLENKDAYSDLERVIIIGLRKKIDWARGRPAWKRFTDEAGKLIEEVIEDIDFEDFLISAMRTAQKDVNDKMNHTKSSISSLSNIIYKPKGDSYEAGGIKITLDG